MPGTVSITPWHWAGFVLVILACLALDLGCFIATPWCDAKEALLWSLVWFLLALPVRRRARTMAQPGGIASVSYRLPG